MDKILKLVVVAVILYFAFTVGLPWLQGMMGGATSRLGPNASEEALCAAGAERAVDDFADRLRAFSSPPIDTDDWDDTVSRTRDQIVDAENACRCDPPACREAAKALSLLDNMVSDFDNNVRNGRGLPPNGARHLERIYDSVNEARRLAR